MNIVAIIPARGGSKGIPRKNIIEFCGRPLLAWSVRQAKSVPAISSVWVTSDDQEILDCAVNEGASTILRPDEISGDAATSESAWVHAVTEISAQQRIDLVVGMQATSPLREPLDIANAIDLFQKQKFDSLFSASNLQDHFIWKNDGCGGLRSVTYDYRNRQRRQVIEPSYLENGSFFIFSPSGLLTTNNRLHGRIGCYVMPFYKSFQIDSVEDLDLCKVIMAGYGLHAKC